MTKATSICKMSKHVLRALARWWPESGLAATAALTVMFRLGSQGLWPDEVRYAEIAREMLETHDFLVPHLNYVVYPEKPPLIYWLTALAFRLFGINEFAARLPCAAFALLGVVAVYAFGRITFDRERALLSGAILITCPLYAVMAQVLTMDMPFAVLTTIALFAMYLSLSSGRIWLYVCYGAITLGVLTKGLAALVLPAAVALTLLLWQRKLAPGVKKLAPWYGLPVVALASGWWFFIMEQRAPGFINFYFLGEHVRRFLDPTYSHSGPLYFYVPVIFLGMAPWSLIPILVPYRFLPSQASTFCGISATVVFAFFSVAQAKLVPYILPALPSLAVILADYLFCSLTVGAKAKPALANGSDGFIAYQCHEGQMWKTAGDDNCDTWVGMRRLSSLLLASGVLAIVCIPIAHKVSPSPYLAAINRPLLALGLALLVGGAMARSAFVRNSPAWGVACIVLTSAAALTISTFARSQIQPLRSFADLAKRIDKLAGEADIICYGRYVQDLPFYTRRRVILIGHPTELRFGFEHAKDVSRYYSQSDRQLSRIWRSEENVVVVIDEEELKRLKPQLAPYEVIARTRNKFAIVHPEYARSLNLKAPY